VRVSEIRVLRRIFEPKRDEVIRTLRMGSSIICSYSSPNISRMIKLRRIIWARHVAGLRIIGMKNSHKIMAGKPEENTPLGRPRRRWKDNNEIDLKEIGQDRNQWRTLVNTAMNLRVT
jgi:hypothetical protein